MRCRRLGAGSAGSGAVRAGVGENGSMTVPELAPRRPLGGIVAVWVVAAIVGIAIAVLVPSDARAIWMAIALGGCLVLAFGVQLWYGRPQRFIQRVALSALGAMLVLGIVTAALGLTSITTALG